MADLDELMLANRRFTILAILAGDAQYSAEIRLLQRALETVNLLHAVPLDQLRREVRWLGAQLLVDLDFDGDCLFLKLTQRGLDVAEGRAVVDGVDREALP